MNFFDTANVYAHGTSEEFIGQSLKNLGVEREDVVLASKVYFNEGHLSREAIEREITGTLERLGTDYLDLYIIHQPFGDYYGAYRAMEELHTEGRIRAIGVANFYTDRYLDLVHQNDVAPAVNQREIHPFNQQKEIFEFSKAHGTLLQAWGAVGQGNKEILENPVLVDAAAAHGKSVQQVMLRWHVQRGVAAVAKSTHAERLAANIDVFDFALTDAEMAAIAGLDRQQPNAGFNHRDPRMFEALKQFD